MVNIKFKKVLTLPGQLEPNTVYFVRKSLDSDVEIVVSDNTPGRTVTYGTVKGWSKSELLELIRAAPLTGVDVSDKTAISDTDAVLAAFGKLQGQYNDLSSKLENNGMFESIPISFSGGVITVTKPYLRQFIWNPVTSKYERAPWNQPGLLKFSYHNAKTMPGYIRIDGQVTIKRSEYPELADLLIDQPGHDEVDLINMDGQFIRVLYTDSTVDPLRKPLTKQIDAMRNLTGDFYTVGCAMNEETPIYNQGVFHASVPEDTFAKSFDLIDGGTGFFTINFNASLSPGVSIAAENRPVNVAFPLWISY